MKSEIPRKSALFLVTAVVLMALSDCSSDQSVGWSDIVQAAKAVMAPPSSVTLQDAAKIPFATIGVRLGEGPQQILIMASDVPTQRLWTSPAHVAVVTDQGRVVRTSGFGQDLSWLEFDGPHKNPVLNKSQLVKWIVDFSDIRVYSTAVFCADSPIGEEVVTLLGSKIKTERIQEICSCQTLNWNFTNSYWIDDTGTVWKSIQNIHPDSPPLEIELLRPPEK